MIEQEGRVGQLNMERQRAESKRAGIKAMHDGLESDGFTAHSRFRLDVEDDLLFLQNYLRVGLLKERLSQKAMPYLEEQLLGIEVKPRLELIEGQDEVKLDGITIGLTPKQAAVLRVLANYVGRQVLSRQVSLEALDNPNVYESDLRDYVASLKRRLNKSDKPEIIVSSGRKARGSWVMLQGVDVVWPVGEEKIEQRPEEGKGVVQEVEVIREEPIDLLTVEEAAMIANLLVLPQNKQLVEKHGFEAFPREYLERLVSDREEQVLDKSDLQKQRIKAIEHLRNILTSEHMLKTYDNQNPDIQSLFAYFADTEKALDLLEDLLNTDIVLSWQGSTKGADVIDVTPVVLPKQTEVAGETPKPQSQPLFEVIKKPLVLEVRTQMETEVLRTIIDQLAGQTMQRKLNFLELQRVLFRIAAESGENRLRNFYGESQIRIFRPEEIKRIFSEAFRKIMLEGKNVEVLKQWEESKSEDQRLLSDLSLAMEQISGANLRGFQNTIESLIDRSEREFYHGEQPLEWINIDRVGV